MTTNSGLVLLVHLGSLPDPPVPEPSIPDRVICPDCGAEVPNDGTPGHPNCFYCETYPLVFDHDDADPISF